MTDQLIELAGVLTAASNYIDKLGGDSKSYRITAAAIASMAGQGGEA